MDGRCSHSRPAGLNGDSYGDAQCATFIARSVGVEAISASAAADTTSSMSLSIAFAGAFTKTGPRWTRVKTRSEEHTSELQSRGHLVCRLLLEKKKKD